MSLKFGHEHKQMPGNNLFFYPYASFTNAQLPLLKVAALWFDKLVILDPVGASWDTVGADHLARDAASIGWDECNEPQHAPARRWEG